MTRFITDREERRYGIEERKQENIQRMLLCLNTAIKACALRFVRNFPDSQKIKQKCKKKFKSIYPECGIMYAGRKTSGTVGDICFSPR